MESTHKVMVIDDDAALLQTLGWILKDRGYDVVAVSDGTNLLSQIEQERPDLILLDLNMPKIDGREALAEIKADPNLRRIPVVVLTVSKAEEDIFRTYDLGIAGYIPKPVTFEGLVEVMKSLGTYWIEIVSIPEDGV